VGGNRPIVPASNLDEPVVIQSSEPQPEPASSRVEDDSQNGQQAVVSGNEPQPESAIEPLSAPVEDDGQSGQQGQQNTEEGIPEGEVLEIKQVICNMIGGNTSAADLPRLNTLHFLITISHHYGRDGNPPAPQIAQALLLEVTNDDNGRIMEVLNDSGAPALLAQLSEGGSDQDQKMQEILAKYKLTGGNDSPPPPEADTPPGNGVVPVTPIKTGDIVSQDSPASPPIDPVALVGVAPDDEVPNLEEEDMVPPVQVDVRSTIDQAEAAVESKQLPSSMSPLARAIADAVMQVASVNPLFAAMNPKGQIMTIVYCTIGESKLNAIDRKLAKFSEEDGLLFREFWQAISSPRKARITEDEDEEEEDSTGQVNRAVVLAAARLGSKGAVPDPIFGLAVEKTGKQIAAARKTEYAVGETQYVAAAGALIGAGAGSVDMAIQTLVDAQYTRRIKKASVKIEAVAGIMAREYEGAQIKPEDTSIEATTKLVKYNMSEIAKNAGASAAALEDLGETEEQLSSAPIKLAPPKPQPPAPPEPKELSEAELRNQPLEQLLRRRVLLQDLATGELIPSREDFNRLADIDELLNHRDETEAERQRQAEEQAQQTRADLDEQKEKFARLRLRYALRPGDESQVVRILKKGLPLEFGGAMNRATEQVESVLAERAALLKLVSSLDPLVETLQSGNVRAAFEWAEGDQEGPLTEVANGLRQIRTEMPAPSDDHQQEVLDLEAAQRGIEVVQSVLQKVREVLDENCRKQLAITEGAEGFKGYWIPGLNESMDKLGVQVLLTSLAEPKPGLKFSDEEEPVAVAVDEDKDEEEEEEEAASEPM
jgi:hypothetical protein